MSSLNSGQTPALIWGMPTRRKWMVSGWTSMDPNQAQTVHSICSSYAHPVWEPHWSQPWHGRWQCPLSTHFAIFFTPLRKQRNWGRSGSALSHSELSNAITAEINCSLAWVNQFKLTFSKCFCSTNSSNIVRVQRPGDRALSSRLMILNFFSLTIPGLDDPLGILQNLLISSDPPEVSPSETVLF